MRVRRSKSFFMKSPTDDFIIKGLSGELENSDADLDIEDQQLSNGQNIIPISDTSLGKRDGITLYNNFLGSGSGVDGGFSFTGANGTQEELVVWGGSLYHNVAGTWTAITGVSLTSGTPCDGVYFENTDTFYITNGTDTVVKYTAGSTSGTQSNSIPKGKYITVFQSVLILSNVPNHPSRAAYADGAGVDTFANGYNIDLPGEFKIAITGTISYNNIALLFFSKRRIFRLQNFAFDGTTVYIPQLYELPVEFGAVYERTIQIVQNKVYFLGQDMNQLCAVYVTDGYTAQNISYKKIRGLTSKANATNITNACAISDSVFYRVYFSDDSQADNTNSIIYDTSKNIFLTPEIRFVLGISDFSCLWSAEINGLWTVFAGTQVNGQVYKLHGNTGLYDELPEEQYVNTAASSNETTLAIEANPAKRGAESFKLHNYNISQTLMQVTQVYVYIKTVSGTNTNLQLRIETDNAGAPSGTLADANGVATILSTSVTASNSWVGVKFTTPPKLMGNTTYWVVLKHVTEGSGNSKYTWHSRSDGNYAFGNGSQFASSAWVAQAGNANFIVYVESTIDAFFDTRAFLPNKGREFSMKRFQVIFSNPSTSPTTLLISFASDQFTSFKTYNLNISSNSSSIYGTVPNGGSGKIYGTVSAGGSGAIYGSQTRLFQFTSIDNMFGRTLKLRVRNNQPNQQFEFNQLNAILAPRERNF